MIYTYRLLRIIASQVRTIRRLVRIIERQQGRIRLVEKERDQARADAETVMLLVPENRRRDACAIVRTRHEIVSQPEVGARGSCAHPRVAQSRRTALTATSSRRTTRSGPDPMGDGGTAGSAAGKSTGPTDSDRGRRDDQQQ